MTGKEVETWKIEFFEGKFYEVEVQKRTLDVVFLLLMAGSRMCLYAGGNYLIERKIMVQKQE